MDSKPQYFSEEFKRMVIGQVSTGLMNKQEANLRYGIKGKSLILNWQRNYEKYGRCCVALPGNHTLSGLKTKKPSSKTIAPEELQAKIERLERQLEDEQLRSEAYQRIIDIAEKEFDIPIRKKPSTK
jgi:transposase-like protein